MIHDPMMHNPCINYPNNFKLCRENHATGKLNFAEQKTTPIEHKLLKSKMTL